MKEPLWTKVLPAGLAGVGLCILAFWWLSKPSSQLVERRPGADLTDGETGTNAASAKWEGKLVKGPAVAPTNFTGLWPWFRGPERSAISTETTPLARSWPEGGPKVLWKIDVGEGYAATAIRQGRVYLIDYDQPAKADALRCLSLADGREIWRYTYAVKVKRFHGMSRTIPAVTDQYVVSLGPKCHVVCCDALTGELQWKMDLVREFNVTVPEWYAGQCPLVDGDRVILGTGGDALVIAVDLATGKVVWKSRNPHKWEMTHSSLMPVEINQTRMYVYCASRGVAGVAAQDGAVLWETPDWVVKMANIAAPLYVGDRRLFLSGGYDAGSMMIQLQPDGDKFKVKPLFRLRAKVFGSEQQTPIFYENHIFGVRPKPDEQLVCLNLDGKIVWSSGAANKFGAGPYMIAQGMLFVLNNDGVLTLAEASTTGFKKLAQARVLQGHESWGPMALADGRLIVRDMTQMACLDVSAQ